MICRYTYIVQLFNLAFRELEIESDPARQPKAHLQEQRMDRNGIPAFAAGASLPPFRARSLTRPRPVAPRRIQVSMHVVVSGATGRTGRLVHALLRASPTPVKALVRSEAKGREVLGLNASLIVADITDAPSMSTALDGADALILVTSAVLQLKSPGPPPVFGFLDGGYPEAVDYHGAVNQIEAAKRAGLKQVVFIGSMGGTDEDHALNKHGNGNILIWKRKAEQYLIDSGVPYTIINPSGLQDIPPGEREIIFGREDDTFEKYDRMECSISRGDVARVAVAALQDPNAINKAFDCASHATGDFVPTTDFSKLFSLAAGGL